LLKEGALKEKVFYIISIHISRFFCQNDFKQAWVLKGPWNGRIVPRACARRRSPQGKRYINISADP